jgi:hypothetical protein
MLTVESFYAVAVAVGNICHRDLASRNVLVFEGNVLKVSDFGKYLHNVFWLRCPCICRSRCFRILTLLTFTSTS